MSKCPLHLRQYSLRTRANMEAAFLLIRICHALTCEIRSLLWSTDVNSVHQCSDAVVHTRIHETIDRSNQQTAAVTAHICRPCMSDIHLLAYSHPLSAFSRRTDMRSGSFLMAARVVVCKDADTILHSWRFLSYVARHLYLCVRCFRIILYLCDVSGSVTAHASSR